MYRASFQEGPDLAPLKSLDRGSEAQTGAGWMARFPGLGLTGLGLLLILVCLDTSAYGGGGKKKRRKEVVGVARGYIGTPYRFGGVTSEGMDCSGLVAIAYRKVKVALPRTAEKQYKEGKKVGACQIEGGRPSFFQIWG